MKTDQLEATLSGYYKNLPHLPKEARTWLADNIWWLAWIGAALSIVGLVVVIPALLIAFGITASVASVYGAYSTSWGSDWLSLVLSLISYIVTTGLLIAAVKPLKVKAKKGWNYIFWSYLISFALNIINAVIVFNFSSILSSIVYAAVAGYFLFEIHSYFGVHHKVAHKVEKKKA